ncbi:MAG: YihY/virulence factor BrkB family protein [Nitriliruptorales bacterium]|nr:YihY/virulence factor BrkB family protein [Nitriliruptorales bacterium]
MHPVTKKLIHRAPPRIRPGVALVLRTIDDTIQDRVPGLAAEIAFFTLLSLPALLLTVLAGVGFLGDLVHADFQQDFADELVELSANALSTETVNEVIEPTVQALIVEGRGSLLSIAFIITLVAASRAVKVVLTAISIAYDIPEVRTGFQQRLWGLGLTLLGLVVGAAVVPVFVAGPRFGQQIEDWLARDISPLPEVWSLVYWPLTVIVLTVLIASFYHFGAPWDTPWRRDLPGAFLAMLVWIGGTVGLRFYVGRTITGDAAYDPLSSALVLLLWLYVSGFAILLGAEFNAEVEKLWPVHGQTPTGPAEETRVFDALPDPDKVHDEAPT